MDDVSVAGVQFVALAPGEVEISVARHAEGGLSVIAWRVADGRRVGYLSTVRGAPAALTVADDYAATPLARLLQSASRQEARHVPRPRPAGRLARLAPDEQAALGGLHWLLTELGEEISLEQLADHLLTAPA
jgi:hypothetical protein